MKFLNAMDIDDLRDRYGANDNNLGRAVRLIAAVRDHADSNSDGWHNWPKPCRACARLIALLDQCGALRPWSGAAAQPTDKELRAAVAPIRAFYTRAGRNSLFPNAGRNSLFPNAVRTYPAFPDYALE